MGGHVYKFGKSIRYRMGTFFRNSTVSGCNFYLVT